MRSIDADALIADIKECIEAKYDNYECKQAEGLKVALSCVDNAPTIEPERKKGEWIPVTNGRGGHCCNRCNGYAPSYMNGDEHLSDYCPYCGSYNGG